MRRGPKTVITGALIALTAAALPFGWAWAQVRIETPPSVSAPPGSVIVTPPTSTTTTTIPGAVVVPQTLQADEIKARQVRANTIYANRIEADEIRGMIHQSKGIKVSNAEGEVKAPEVVASVIYADKITANSVIADNVYVRDVKRR